MKESITCLILKSKKKRVSFEENKTNYNGVDNVYRESDLLSTNLINLIMHRVSERPVTRKDAGARLKRTTAHCEVAFAPVELFHHDLYSNQASNEGPSTLPLRHEKSHSLTLLI